MSFRGGFHTKPSRGCTRKGFLQTGLPSIGVLAAGQPFHSLTGLNGPLRATSGTGLDNAMTCVMACTMNE